MTLDNETKTDTVAHVDSKAIFSNVPHRYVGQQIRLSVTCRDFMPIDTTVTLAETLTIDIYRDANVYGSIQFKLWNQTTEQVVAGCEVEIGGYKAVSDNEGQVSLFIPLDEQKTSYTVSAAIPLLDNTIYTPCGENDVLLTE